MSKLRLLFVFALLLSILTIAPVFAHEGREVGEYLIEFGWREEPAYAGLPNGPEVTIEHHDGADLPTEVDLRAEVSFGGQSMELLLESLTDGHYVATLIPTLPGDYTFRVFGTIGDTEVNETFSSADGEFSTVEPSTDIMFPSVESTDVAALIARIEALEARVAELEAK